MKMLAPRPHADRVQTRLAAFLLALFCAGCATFAAYDPTSYKTATDLKAESLLLIGKAAEPAAAHAQEIDALQLKLQQALEYEKGKGDPNRLTYKQWQILIDPERDLLGNALKRWRSAERGLSAAYVEGASANIGAAFDRIITLERGKVKK